MHLRKLLVDNYDTLSNKDFIQHKVPDPNDPLPSHVISGVSGFAQNVNRTLPTQREVRSIVQSSHTYTIIYQAISLLQLLRRPVARKGGKATPPFPGKFTH